MVRVAAVSCGFGYAAQAWLCSLMINMSSPISLHFSRGLFDTCPSLLPIFQGINEGPASLQGSPPDPVLVLLLCLLGAKLSPHLDRR